MAISNIHETLLMYTKQKNAINSQLSNVMMDMVIATRQNAENQQKYNQALQDAYYDPVHGYDVDVDAYMLAVEDLENDHEFELANLESWESSLELKKNSLETQLNEITSYESSWNKLLQNNIKGDFTYGSVGGGS